jgi:hypothetical protein
MNIDDAESFVYAWGLWERGRAEGIEHAIEMVENRLCREGTNAQQREVLIDLYDSLRETKPAASAEFC